MLSTKTLVVTAVLSLGAVALTTLAAPASGGAPPVANAGVPQFAECSGANTPVLMDGSASFDPDGGGLRYQWTTDCDWVKIQKSNSATPTLMVQSQARCGDECHVKLLVTDREGKTSQDGTAIVMRDTTPPSIQCTQIVHLPKGSAYDPQSIGFATVSDICDPKPALKYRDDFKMAGNALLIHRQWKASDVCGNESICDQYIEVSGKR